MREMGWDEKHAMTVQPSAAAEDRVLRWVRVCAITLVVAGLLFRFSGLDSKAGNSFTATMPFIARSVAVWLRAAALAWYHDLRLTFFGREYFSIRSSA